MLLFSPKFIIAKFQYTFFDALGRDKVPLLPITPFPTLSSSPIYRSSNNLMELTVSNFFYQGSQGGCLTPLEIWLGAIGPLPHRVLHTAEVEERLKVPRFIGSMAGIRDSTRRSSETDCEDPGSATGVSAISGSEILATMMIPPSLGSSGSNHTAIVVELPELHAILKTIQDGVNTASNSSIVQNDKEAVHTSRTDGNYANFGFPVASISGRGLPLLFVRSLDGIGYHSGRSIVCENVFRSMEFSDPSDNTEHSTSRHARWFDVGETAPPVVGGMNGWMMHIQ